MATYTIERKVKVTTRYCTSGLFSAARADTAAGRFFLAGVFFLAAILACYRDCFTLLSVRCRHRNPSVSVFDNGVTGAVAQTLGWTLRILGNGHQVFAGRG